WPRSRITPPSATALPANSSLRWPSAGARRSSLEPGPSWPQTAPGPTRFSSGTGTASAGCARPPAPSGSRGCWWAARRSLARAWGDGFFERHGVGSRWERPAPGPIGFPRRLVGNVEEFCRGLVHEAGVLLFPGTVFDVNTPHFRLGLGRADFPQAMDRREEVL